MTHALGRTVCIVQARVTSTRLPGKVMLPLAGVPLLTRMLQRALIIPGVDLVCLAIPEGEAQAPLRRIGRDLGLPVVVGPEDDVLARFLLAAEATGATTIVRVTSDCPLMDPLVSGTVLAMTRSAGAVYGRTAIDSGYPLGLDTEVVATSALQCAVTSADTFEREHVTPFVWRRPEQFPFLMLDRRPDRRAWRLTVDTAEDYALTGLIYDALHPRDASFGFAAIETFLLAHPEHLTINASVAHTSYTGWKS